MSANTAAAAAAAAVPTLAVLDVEAIDCEVFERLIMRILTSLRRLYHKISYELDQSEMGRRGAFSQANASDDQRSYLWTLTRRVTRRIEKLRALLDVLVRKKELTLERIAKQQSAKTVTANDVYLLEALHGKVEKTITEYEDLESFVMRSLCSV